MRRPRLLVRPAPLLVPLVVLAVDTGYLAGVLVGLFGPYAVIAAAELAPGRLLAWLTVCAALAGGLTAATLLALRLVARRTQEDTPS